MSAQPCQSTVAARLGPAPCQALASTVLVGVHLCGMHDRAWRPKLAAGGKIRIHPERALALDHVCAAPADGPSRTCTRCGLSQPSSQFRAQRGKTYSWCRPCECQYQMDLYRRQRGAGTETAPPPAALPSPPAEPVLVAPAPRPPKACATPGCTRPIDPSTRENGGRVWCLECQFAGTGLPPDEPAAGPMAHVYLVEFVCLACSRFICEVKVASEQAAVQLPPRLKCRACGGTPVRSGEVRRLAMAERPDPTLKVPRGRPPLERAS